MTIIIHIYIVIIVAERHYQNTGTLVDTSRRFWPTNSPSHDGAQRLAAGVCCTSYGGFVSGFHTERSALVNIFTRCTSCQRDWFWGSCSTDYIIYGYSLYNNRVWDSWSDRLASVVHTERDNVSQTDNAVSLPNNIQFFTSIFLSLFT